MRGKKVNGIIATILLAVFLLPAIALADDGEVAITVKGNVVCVGSDGDCATISEGLETVSEGGMVNVAAGTYPGEMWDEPIHGGCLLKSLSGERQVEFQKNGVTITTEKTGEGTPVMGTALLVDGVEKLPTKREVVHFDLYLSDTAGVETLTTTVTLPKGALTGLDRNSLVVYWHDGYEWKKCSDYTLENPTDQLTIRFDNHTSPTLAGLNGTPFGVGGSLSTARQLMALIPIVALTCAIVAIFMAIWRRIDVVTVAFLLIVTVIFVVVMIQLVGVTG